MPNAFICEGIRTPIGRFGGALAQVRTDDLAATPLMALREQFGKSDWESVDEVIFGCANQSGEDNRNVARMAKMYGTASMPETAENVAEKYKIGRAAQDCFALRSQLKAAAAQKAGIF